MTAEQSHIFKSIQKEAAALKAAHKQSQTWIQWDRAGEVAMDVSVCHLVSLGLQYFIHRTAHCFTVCG